MWTCPKCQRIFEREGQQHSCQSVPLESHFAGKELAQEIFNYLLSEIEANIGKCKVISLPCCVHLFGRYDFLAALPKKDRLEIRFGLTRALKGKRVKIAVPTTQTLYKNCLDLHSKDDVDAELLAWLSEAYNLKS